MSPKIAIDKNIFKKHKVKLAYLFGSQAKGNASEESDFDVAVLFEEKPEVLDFFDESAYLKEDLRPYFLNEVDVAALNNAGSLLKYEVISNGHVLYSDDESYRIDFEVRSTKEYIDNKYILDVYYTALEKRLKEGAS